MKRVCALSILIISGLWASPEALLQKAQTIAGVRDFKQEIDTSPLLLRAYSTDAIAIFAQLCKTPHGIRLLYYLTHTANTMAEISSEYNAILQNLFKKCLEHINLLTSQKIGLQLLRLFYSYHAEAYIADLRAEIIQSFKKIQGTLYGPLLMSDCMNYYEHYGKRSFTGTLHTLTTLTNTFASGSVGSWSLLSDYAQYGIKPGIPYVKDIYTLALLKPMIYRLWNDRDAQTIIDTLLHTIEKPTTPTTQHIYKYFSDVAAQFESTGTCAKYTRDPLVLKMGRDIIAKEAELKDTHFTFLTKQSWEHHLYSRWFTKLWEIQHHKKLDNFYFLRIKQMPQNNQVQYNLRKEMIQGSTETNSEFILLMNHTLFAHTFAHVDDDLGTRYNHAHSIGFKEIFDLFEYQKIYEKYHTELEILAKKHSILNSWRSAVLVAVPKSFVEKSVYGIDIYNNEHKSILYILQNYNSASYETNNTLFCLCLTTDRYGGLNPDSGIQIYMFHPTDPEEYAAFLEDEHALFEKIARDIQGVVPASAIAREGT